MALPTTNLVFHGDASDTDNVFTTWDSGGNHSGVPADGNAVQVWDDEDDGAADIALVFSAGGSEPAYRSSAPLMQLPCLDFNGTDDDLQFFNHIGTVSKPLSALITDSACCLALSLYVEGATSNSANPWANHIVLGDAGAFFALAVRTDGGGNYYVYLYNWDGNADVVELPIDLNTSYVVIAQHTGGNLTLTKITDGTGTEDSATPVASGNTTTLTGAVQVGHNASGGGAFYNGRIGEMAIYNAAVSGSDLTDLKAYFYQKWFPAAARRFFLMGH